LGSALHLPSLIQPPPQGTGTGTANWDPKYGTERTGRTPLHPYALLTTLIIRTSSRRLLGRRGRYTVFTADLWLSWRRRLCPGYALPGRFHESERASWLGWGYLSGFCDTPRRLKLDEGPIPPVIMWVAPEVFVHR